MTTIFLDTNIILDIALERPIFFQHSSKIFEKLTEGRILCFLSATSIKDIYFLISKEKSKEIAKEFILDLVEIMQILAVDRNIVIHAVNSDFSDFEDSIQNSVADLNGIDWIITRNKKDFRQSRLQVLSPEEALERL
ncbi:PIN domain-containing protein [Algoriphagus sp. AK58]|uniref:type II toxin-antitoxin system VapC family toxin n=1 Tax=Algoriphagus sp. AK58 TaxID=1406877 RepID=UPI00164F4744|nr:PIN domain-containing protein [Algoriphagus sp. AK58]MBC6366796.1 PIN domain nuclease [Algoriphagus sp. AK58]